MVTISPPTLSVLRAMAARVRTPRLRTLQQFAEQELILPSGPFEGRRFSPGRQPMSRLWFSLVQSGQWRRLVTTGPTQSGKTLLGSVLPVMYHLFEVGETVIYGVPTLDMVADKWSEDLLPAISASRYRELLPKHGPGSRGGSVRRVTFRNGATLRFMTGGGGDKSRAGYTSRVLVITETDGMDEAGEGSREADKITQLEQRTAAFGDRARIYMECTVSIEEGRTWQEYSHGTATRILVRCPHCRKYVTPEREHLVGWQDAADVLEASDKARFACPSCGEIWSEADRIAANHDCLPLHRGMSQDDLGKPLGTPARTDTLGFRWTAANNLLVSTGTIAQAEWKAARAADEENAEKGMRQFWWALPHQPAAVDLATLDHQAITRRVTADPRGRCPSDTRCVTVGIDIGKWLCHWVAIAWREHGTPHVLEYGRIEVASADLGEEAALMAALRQFRDDVCRRGWEADNGTMEPELVLIDSGYLEDVVYRFCEECPPGYLPAKGWSAKEYRHPARKDARVKEIGEQYHLARQPRRRMALAHVNSDYWKTRVHARLTTPLGQPGAMTLHNGTAVEHLTLAKHLTAEKQVQKFEAGRGTVVRWEVVHRNNHLLDACMLANAAGHRAGARILEGEKVEDQGKGRSWWSERRRREPGRIEDGE